jgi:hypothetical protein
MRQKHALQYISHIHELHAPANNSRKSVIARKQMLFPFQALYLENSHSDSS